MNRVFVALRFHVDRIDDLLPGAYTVMAHREEFRAVTVCPICEELEQTGSSY
jgi:hypothetical protein